MRPLNPKDEPSRPKHIDGSNISAGPAVFQMVQSPKEPITRRSSLPCDGIHGCGTISETNSDKTSTIQQIKRPPPGDNLRNYINVKTRPITCIGSRSSSNSDKSTPQKIEKPRRPPDSYIKSRNVCGSVDEMSAIQKIEKVRDSRPKTCVSNQRTKSASTDSLYANMHDRKCSQTSLYLKRQNFHKSSPNLSSGSNCFKKHVSRECRSPKLMVPLQEVRPKSEYKMAFKAGVPHSQDSCSSGTNKCDVKVPKQRDPYAKRNYDINSLSPPFSMWKGASCHSYPEHWRLASVYQHSYKPVEARKGHLLQSVYQ